MFSTARSAGLLAGVTVTVVAVFFAATATATASNLSGSTLTPGNSCANPVLEDSSTGWKLKSGGSAKRVSITNHVAATHAFRATAKSTSVTMTLPAQAVTGGQVWTFAADSLLSSSGSVRMGVDWYNSHNHKLSHVDGSTTSVGSSTWQQVMLSAKAPSGAVRAVPSQKAKIRKGAYWWSTACDIDDTLGSSPPTTTTTAPPTTSPSPSPSPGDPGDGTQAAVRYDWGTPTGGDEFNGSSVNTSRWYLYDSPGQDGKGLRRPAQISVSNGILTISGTSKGTTGGMASQTGHKYGRWETRMRVPLGDHRYHPVLILWPDAEDWPKGGEVDYAETTAAADDVDFYLHYSSSNNTTTDDASVDITQWHDYAVEWTSSGIRGYLDGTQFFSDTSKSHLPPRSMHQTIQLDWFPNGSSSTTPSSMQVAWNRYYPIS